LTVVRLENEDNRGQCGFEINGITPCAVGSSDLMASVKVKPRVAPSGAPVIN
jgi:hypothetical protein